MIDAIFRYFEDFARPFEAVDPRRPPADGLRFILHFARQSKGPFIAMFVVGLAQALVEAGVFIFVGVIVDLMASGPRSTFIADNAWTIAGMVFVVVVLRFLIAFSTAVLEEQIVVPHFFTMVRWQSHLAVARQDVGFFDDEMAGRVSQKVWQGGQAAGDFMVSLLQIIWFITVFALTTLVVIASLDIAMLLPVVVWIALIGVVAWRFVPQIRSRGRAAAEAGSVVTGRMVDGYSNIRTVKLFSAEEANDAFIRDGWEGFLAAIRRFTRSISGMRIASQGVSSIMLVVVGGSAIWLYQQGSLSAGEVAIVLALSLRLNLLMGRLLGLLNGLFRNLGTVQNSAELIARNPVVVDRAGAPELNVGTGDIRFDKVDFAYPGSGIVLTGFDLAIAAGERVGVVGPSGVGKTTLMNVLLRFYDVDGGRITVGGTDIATVAQASLRSNIGVVTQDNSLLHRSIRENIAYGRDDATDDAIIRAAKRTSAHDFIVDLHDAKGRSGYDTRVGERGVKLSGGQRQRIALARVFLKDAPILLLDEATSALDSEIEAAIQDNLEELMRGKTVIAIAHRLSTIAHLDRLVVMDEGGIVEEGTHTELLANRGLYARLWERQSGGFLPDDAG